MAMQKCPVCEGRQTMPEAFYTRATIGSRASSYVQCRSCNGRGIMFTPDPVPQSPQAVKPRSGYKRIESGGVVCTPDPNIKYEIINEVARGLSAGWSEVDA